jgi:large subunit ribosomal protein L35
LVLTADIEGPAQESILHEQGLQEKGKNTMPKLKTNRSAAKRFKITKTGKIKKRSANRGHILGKMSRKRKRVLRKSGYLDKVEEKKIRRLLPYGTN